MMTPEGWNVECGFTGQDHKKCRVHYPPTNLCLGTMMDLGVNGKLINVAVKIMRAWQQECAERCFHCSRPIVATIADGSTPHRKACEDGYLDICDECYAKAKAEDSPSAG